MQRKIVVVGLGYVGLSYALCLSQKHSVTAIDISHEKISLLNKGKSPINNKEFNEYIAAHGVNFNTFEPDNNLYKDADFILIATPTDYIEKLNAFDTSSVDKTLADIKESGSKATIIIKSTCPVGYTRAKDSGTIYFSPEFLREDKPLTDIINPSRIIIGGKDENLAIRELLESVTDQKCEVIFTTSDEAEAIKLFSNTYLAMRVAFFNEVDTFAIEKKLDIKHLIKGISLDKRIGAYYNNPSFGYGGYCLPKDTKELKEHFNEIPSALIGSIVLANDKRKQYIIKDIESLNPDKNKTIGIYRLAMKANSENYRFSSILDVVKGLKNDGYKLVIFEPSIKGNAFENIDVINDFEAFISTSDFIVTNRIDEQIKDIKKPLYTRDLFNKD